jgi:hypothetical protein
VPLEVDLRSRGDDMAKALEALGDAVYREIRIVEGVD